jgi:preprotein translocase subunit SecB
MPVPEPHPMTRDRVIAKVQYIKDLSFEVPRATAIYQAIRIPPALDVRLDVRSSLIAAEDRTYEVILTVRIVARDTQLPHGADQSIEFVADLSYGGMFSLDAIATEDTDEVLSVECPHILYPFACAILADLSRDANFAPISLGPVDFEQLWRERLARETAS